MGQPPPSAFAKTLVATFNQSRSCFASGFRISVDTHSIVRSEIDGNQNQVMFAFDHNETEGIFHAHSLTRHNQTRRMTPGREMNCRDRYHPNPAPFIRTLLAAALKAIVTGLGKRVQGCGWRRWAVLVRVKPSPRSFPGTSCRFISQMQHEKAQFDGNTISSKTQ